MQITKTENSITVRFSEEELIFLADSLIDPLAWIEILTVEKVANCKDRLFKEWTAKLQQDKRVESIPTDDVTLINLITDQHDYKNRANRDADII